MAVGDTNALLSHASALALLDLSDIPDDVHLLVPRRHRRTLRVGARPPCFTLAPTTKTSPPSGMTACRLPPQRAR